MTYFEDLSHYKYFPVYPENYRNVGWLSRSHPFPTGSVSAQCLLNLQQLCKQPINPCLGTHDCEFCEIPADIVGTNKEHTYRWERNLLGNGEIHVPGQNGLVYVAPALIHHYVRDHHYQPPAEFIGAVERLGGRSFRAKLAFTQKVYSYQLKLRVKVLRKVKLLR
jgi:hypothetical protein